MWRKKIQGDRRVGRKKKKERERVDLTAAKGSTDCSPTQCAPITPMPSHSDTHPPDHRPPTSPILPDDGPNIGHRRSQTNFKTITSTHRLCMLTQSAFMLPG